MSKKERLIYRGKVIDLYLEDVEFPNGAKAEFEIVRHPGGSAVVALDLKNCVCLLRQYRFVTDGWLWELPAGKHDKGEDPLLTAQRELEEEAGVQAARWDPLGKIISSPGIFTEVVHHFLARDLRTTVGNAEEHELFEVHWMPLDEALRMVHAGEIIDAKTLVGLFLAREILFD
jgi:8-oxo-dGTP pyrophosphatase MutT (NUDIX family)